MENMFYKDGDGHLLANEKEFYEDEKRIFVTGVGRERFVCYEK